MSSPDHLSGEITRADGHALDALDLPVFSAVNRIDGVVLRGYVPNENPYDAWLELQKGRLPTHEWLNLRWLTSMMNVEADERALAESPVRPLSRSHFQNKENAVEDTEALAIFDVIAGLGRVMLEHDRAMETAELEAHRAVLETQEPRTALLAGPTVKFQAVVVSDRL